MKEIQLKVPSELQREQLNALFDQEVEQFSIWMARLADPLARGALLPQEKALIKTYLVQKHQGALDEVR